LWDARGRKEGGKQTFRKLALGEQRWDYVLRDQLLTQFVLSFGTTGILKDSELRDPNQ